MFTTIVGGVVALIPLLTAYLQIRAAAERFRLQTQIQDYVDKIQDADAALRASGSPADFARADIMRDRALAAAGILSRLPDPVPATNAATGKGSPDPK